jgi:tetratricopeptide (TPR) repeat protein
MASSTEGSPEYNEARATFLSLRHLDHWIALGASGGAPTERSTSTTLEALGTLTEDVELRSALETIVTAIPDLSDADAQPVMPRLFALGSLFERRGQTRLAGDIYGTVAKNADQVAHLDLAYDAHMRSAACLRLEGDLEYADQTYAHAGTLASRERDRAKVLTARVGRAKVVAARGNLPAAMSTMLTIESEARELGASDLVALIMHERAGLAHAMGDFEGALRLVWQAHQLSTDAYDRERMMWDIANFLGRIGAEDAARDALQLIALTTRHQSARVLAQQNLMDLSRRTGNEVAFHQHRRALAEQALPAPRRVSYLLDAGRGLSEFGDVGAARAALTEALRLAESVGLNQRIFQAEQALAELDQIAAESKRTPPARTSPGWTNAPDEISTGLRALLEEATAAA